MTSTDTGDETYATMASAEATKLTYFFRRVALVAVVIAAAGLVVAAATGRLGALGSNLQSFGAGVDAATTVPKPESTTVVAAAAAGVDKAVSPVTVAPDDRVTEAANESSEAERSQAAAVSVPARASRLVAQAPERVLDTRGADDGTPPLASGTTHVITVPANKTAVALSVTLMATERSGSVTIDGLAGAVEVVAVGGPGATVTNLVIVPTVGNELTVRSSSGGHLVVDVVGTFESAPAGSAGGRFVSIDPTRITELETAVDGRQAILSFESAVPEAGTSALLAIITADVGTDGGVVRLGPEDDNYDQMLMWGPADESNRQRRVLALIEPGTDDTSALLYNGGSALTVDIIGYFTGDNAGTGTDGLFVPSGPRLLYSGPLGPDDPIQLTDVEPSSGVALATVDSRSTDTGRLWSVTAPVASGTIQVSASAPVDAEVTLLGVFLG